MNSCEKVVGTVQPTLKIVGSVESPIGGGGGKDGVSPIVEITPISGGNRITITDVNGPKSADIMDGKDGKGAYQYAQEGGYSGTEEEFYAKLAKENSEFDETDPTVPDWAKQPEKPKYTANEVGALPKDTKIPAKTSDISNDSGFITKTVSDLANYYLKSETLTKTEINALVSAIPKFAIQVVNSLPTTDISMTTVYLLKSGIESDLYTEYIYVNGNWEILGSQRVDLTNYALKAEIPTKLSQLTNDSEYITNAVSNLVNYYKKSEVYSKDDIDKKGYLTEQDISGKLDASKLPEAVNAALAQAKASGEFDGKNGSDGVGIKSVVQTTTSSLDGGSNVITVTKTDDTTSTFTVKNGREGSDGKDGYTPIKGVDYFDGKDGSDGRNGTDGKTPVKGVDYYTEADKAEIVAAVIESLGGNPIFGIVDENNNIIVNGDLPDGTYTVKYEMEGGKIINIGNLVLDSNVYYTVTKNLTNCTISNSATEAIGGESYSATITANSGYELKSVTVTMGGSPVNVSGGVINIAEVTGDIVITAVAEEIKASYTNYAQPIEIGRIRATGAVDSGVSAARATAYIPVANGDTVRVKGLDLSSYNMGTYQDANGTVAPWGCALLSAYTSYLNYSLDGDIYTISLTNFNDTLKYVRFSGTLMSGYTEDDVIVTVNEPIS